MTLQPSAHLLEGQPSFTDTFEPHDEAWPSADRMVYRLGLHSRLVGGMPDQLVISGVQAEIVTGPVTAQRTELRQRHGFPPVFDKRLVREPVGSGRALLILSLEVGAPQADEFDARLLQLRARAEAAAGLLSSVLDERVAGEMVFEDTVMFHGSEVVGAADLHSSVRRLLPFDVTASDRQALANIETTSLADDPLLARAARVYRRAVAEGPTPDAFADLWIAVETLSQSRQPSPRELKAVFEDAGIDPDGLPVSIGLLIDLRGKIVHEGAEDHQGRLRLGYYEMESLARLMLRRRAGAESLGWFPASNNPSAYASPFDELVGEWDARHETIWHLEQLPPEEPPGPERFPRRVGRPDQDPRLELIGVEGAEADLLAAVVVTAIEWFDPHAERTRVEVADHDGPARMAIAAGLIKLAPEVLDGVFDEQQPGQLINLAWELTSAVAIARVMEAGLESNEKTAWLLDALGATFQYEVLINHGGGDPSLLRVEEPGDDLELAKLIGWAAAGDQRAAEMIRIASPSAQERASNFTAVVVEGPPWARRFAVPTPDADGS